MSWHGRVIENDREDHLVCGSMCRTVVERVLRHLARRWLVQRVAMKRWRAQNSVVTLQRSSLMRSHRSMIETVSMGQYTEDVEVMMVGNKDSSRS